MTKKQSTVAFILISVALVLAAAAYMKITQTPTPGKNIASTENISVTSPRVNDKIDLPFTIKGSARVFENVVSVRLVEKNTGNILFEGNAHAEAPDIGQFGLFSLQIDYLFAKPTSDQVDLHVFWNSPKDGAAIDPVIVPLTLKSTDTKEIAVYLTQSELNPASQCDTVIPVLRVVPDLSGNRNADSITAQKAVEFLLHGPSNSEQTRGMMTQINPGVKIEDFQLKDGVATIEFSRDLEQGVAGSCRVSAIRAQIEQTLKQFPYIKSVVIKIDNRVDDVLQP